MAKERRKLVVSDTPLDGELTEFNISEEDYNRIFKKVIGNVPSETGSSLKAGRGQKVHNSRDKGAQAMLEEFNNLLAEGKRPTVLGDRIKRRAAKIGQRDQENNPDNDM